MISLCCNDKFVVRKEWSIREILENKCDCGKYAILAKFPPVKCPLHIFYFT